MTSRYWGWGVDQGSCDAIPKFLVIVKMRKGIKFRNFVMSFFEHITCFLEFWHFITISFNYENICDITNLSNKKYFNWCFVELWWINWNVKSSWNIFRTFLLFQKSIQKSESNFMKKERRQLDPAWAEKFDENQWTQVCHL